MPLSSLLDPVTLRRTHPLLHILQLDTWLAPARFVRRTSLWFSAGLLGGLVLSPVPGAGFSLIYLGFFYMFFLGLRGGATLEEFRNTGGFAAQQWSRYRTYAQGQTGFSLLPIWGSTVAQTLPYFIGLSTFAVFSHGGPIAPERFFDPFLGMVGLYHFPVVEGAPPTLFSPVLLTFFYGTVAFLISLTRKLSSTGVAEYANGISGITDPLTVTFLVLGIPIALGGMLLLLLNVLAPEQFAEITEQARANAAAQTAAAAEGRPGARYGVLVEQGTYAYGVFALLWLRDLVATATALVRNKIDKRQRRFAPRMLMGLAYLIGLPLLWLWITYLPGLTDGPVVVLFLAWPLTVVALEPVMNRVLRRVNTIPFTG